MGAQRERGRGDKGSDGYGCALCLAVVCRMPQRRGFADLACDDIEGRQQRRLPAADRACNQDKSVFGQADLSIPEAAVILDPHVMQAHVHSLAITGGTAGPKPGVEEAPMT